MRHPGRRAHSAFQKDREVDRKEGLGIRVDLTAEL